MLYNPSYNGLIKREYEKRGYVCVKGVVESIDNEDFDKNAPLAFYPIVTYRFNGEYHEGKAFLINDSKRPDIGKGKKVYLFLKKNEPNKLFGINRCVFDDNGEVRNPEILEVIISSIKKKIKLFSKKISKLLKNS